ncbi:MAG TPA: outer membrane protein assembly factor BamA [Thermomonas sp.]|jgi:outer membrane protein insertion porin family|uniref:outer membrane protein assembly factor BamA n=1 Tax=Thermomonas sp. TaxID=1971895 RepID=UPI002CB7E7A7|nr:outer membrane protein assembly factor BamA [Thermomonas sp.]HOV95484.1 outer membrane protein assembly factor BamA [Thermomonas sp.]
MTRPLSRRLLTLALASALSLPVWAQTAFTPFTVSDIRIDGLQRIGAGTVFTYLPVERGDTLDQGKAAEAVRALYKTGFFEDVRIDHQGSILVITVSERPAINKLTLAGNKDLKTEDLTKGLKEIGLAEGETYNPLNLDRVTQELTRQYNNRGKYNVSISPSVEHLDRNRVNLTITVKEGKAAKIRHINLIGNDTFKDEDITKGWESHTSNWLSWYKRDDQYSREKLSGDIEKLNSWYLDRGYVDYSLDSTQVAISGDRKDMYLTAGMTEGQIYNFADITVSGDTVLPKSEIETIVAFIKPGNTFSRSLLEFASNAITMRLANIGYAFAKVNPVPNVDRDKRTVAIDFQVQPGPRVNVRRIVFKGNTRTADPVLRREMRQFEGSWYSQAAIDRGKVRLDRLGYFETVDVDSQPVAGSDDQVDVTYTVKETTSGSISAGVGYSQLSGLNLSLQLSENNFLGTGNRVSVALTKSAYQKRYDFSYMNPYFTDDGLSLGYNVWYRQFDYSNFNVAQYSTNSGAVQMFMGLPLSESDSIQVMFGVDSNQILAFEGSTPPPMVDYVKAVGQSTFHSWRTQLSWGRDTRNNYFTPVVGSTQNFSAEIALPGSTVEYFKLQYDIAKYWPLSQALVIKTGLNLGYGDSYGKNISRNLCFTAPLPAIPPTTDNPNPTQPPAPPPPSNPCLTTSSDYIKTVTATGLPFFENFYAGGIASSGKVRGFMDNTLGPSYSSITGYKQPLGGSVLLAGSVEAIFPKLFDSPAARVSAFLDFGNVFNGYKNFSTSELRASAGVALLWRSPMGPLSISYALPLRKKDGDQIERLQFNFGGQL